MKPEIKEALELLIKGVDSLRLTRQEREVFDNAFRLLVNEVTPTETTEEV